MDAKCCSPDLIVVLLLFNQFFVAFQIVVSLQYNTNHIRFAAAQVEHHVVVLFSLKQHLSAQIVFDSFSGWESPHYGKEISDLHLDHLCHYLIDLLALFDASLLLLHVSALQSVHLEAGLVLT